MGFCLRASRFDHSTAVPGRRTLLHGVGRVYAGKWRISVGIRGKIQGHQFTYTNASGTVEVPTSQCHPRS